MLLAGELQDSRLMLELSEIRDNGLSENQARYDRDWKVIEDSMKKYGDRGFDGQKETINSTFTSTRESIERKYSKQVELYTRACTIKIEEEHLFLSITKAMPYGLTPQQKADLLEAHSTEENKAQEISIGEKKFILFDAKIEIPSNLLNEDPRLDLRCTKTQRSVRCISRNRMGIWIKISDRLITQQLNTKNPLWIRVGFLQTNLQKNKIWLYYTNV